MRRIVLLAALCCGAALAGRAQQVLSLDSCRALALRNNKTLAISQAKSQKALYDHKAARTNYFPKISVVGSYMRVGDEISLLSDDQKSALSSLGTNLSGSFNEVASAILQQYPDLAPLVTQAGTKLPGALDAAGREIVDAFHTDNRNMGGGAAVLTQPLYMGGKIRAYDRITRYSQKVAEEQLRADRQAAILDADQAYWQVVSLVNKKKLAEKYLEMLRHLESDVIKMKEQGIATLANELSVSVKVNEAEMTLMKVDDGLTLSRMLLCQVCGLPIDSDVKTADETLQDIPSAGTAATPDVAQAMAARPELAQLRTATDIYNEKVKIEQAARLPQLALTGGYLLATPSLFNGYENKLRGTWSVGLTLSLPVWHWGEAKYKISAAKAEASVARFQLAEAREKIELQVHQSAFRVNEADKKVLLSLKHLEQAEENLRTANVGFREGVVGTSDVLEAQTAWLQAHSDKIDAQIDAQISRVVMQKSLGTLDGQAGLGTPPSIMP